MALQYTARVCRQCGVEFLARNAIVRAGAGIFCSRACLSASQSKRIPLTCDGCKRSFSRAPSLIRPNQKTYCSVQCKPRADKESRRCAHCSTPFLIAVTEKRAGRFCSQACRKAAMKGVSRLKDDPVTRFFAAIEQRGDCWIWTGSQTGKDGYGSIWINGKSVRAHRFAYETLVRPLQRGEEACHHCDTPLCVKADPDPAVSHIFAGSHADNMADAKRKRRTASGDRHTSVLHPERTVRGDTHPNSRLTASAVAEIRAEYAGGEVTQRALAEKWGIDPSTVSNVVTRRLWKHVP